MSVSDNYLEYALEQLRAVTPVTHRRMFGGAGIYTGGLIFALIDDDVLYLKVDDSNRADFESAGMGPFRPFGPEGEAMPYFELPGEVLENTEALERWVEKAVAVARTGRSRPPARPPGKSGQPTPRRRKPR